MPNFFCTQCGRETQFVPLPLARRLAGVSRATIYHWIESGWVHWRWLPSSRRLICRESLSTDPYQNSYSARSEIVAAASIR